jgi:DNA (cytosine-5)-methyltransferase 1
LAEGAYYNEHDPEKAEWIRELIKAGVVADGEVDERSIIDVSADDVRGYTQCHFFAGIAVWSYALRLAGWPDDEPVWTGSCPCPSFSCAGKGEGFDDPRHLWPDWVRLIRKRKPPVIFGEQSDDAIGFGWLDLVQTDLEAENYAVGNAVLGAASVGAPHIRQRLYFGAHVQTAKARPRHGEVPKRTGKEITIRSGDSSASRVGSDSDGRKSSNGDLQRCGEQRLFAPDSGVGHSEHSERTGLEGHSGDVREWRGPGWLDPNSARSASDAGATRGFWADCDWWYGRDGKWRPIGPGLFPLAHGAAARVLRLRGYGDAICAETAKAFIEAYSEARTMKR